MNKPTVTDVTPTEPESITPEEVLGKLREAVASADPFATDKRLASIRQAGQGLFEAIHRADVARKHVLTLDSIVIDLATKALAVLSAQPSAATQSPDAPKRRGRPPGSSNKTPTSDSPAANGGTEPLAD